MNTKLALMDTRCLALAVATFAAVQVGCGGATPAPAEPTPAPAPTAQTTDAPSGDDEVAVTDFTEPLGNYGTWLDDPTYGKVWQPADDVAGDDFVPYSSDGSWTTTDDGSWVFESKYDTEYGWATYHYGRWYENDDYGWVWIPGTTWAPSWVEWRYGGGNVGWAPMGPAGVVVPEERWSFVDQVHFSDPGWRGFRFTPDRIHVAFSAAVALNVGGGGGGGGIGVHFGPPVASIRAAGGAIRTSHVAKPAHGAVKAMAQASVQHAKASNRPKAATATPVKRGPAARAARAQPGAQPTHGKEATKTPPHGEEHAKAEPKGAAKPEPKVVKAEAKVAVKPAPRPEPKPAPKAAPPPKKKK